jgi:2-desacetyl-2-hydroxyethyl bacteriochlorophyllide A dehydrogenase
MKAIVYNDYGTYDVLHLEEVPQPVPGNDEVLVEVYASSVNFANPAMVRGEPKIIRFYGGLKKPKYRIPGGDIAGCVKAVGSEVQQFKPGDEVYGDLSDGHFGGFAEFVAAPERDLVPKPDNLDFQEAAAVPQAAVVALQGLRKAGIRQNRSVLVYGASGGIGTFAVQIARAYGADVTGVCSTRNLDLVRSLGADHVIDYTREDFTRSGKQYDIIIATAGYRSIYDYKMALAPKGSYIMTGGSMKQIFQAMMLGPVVTVGGSRRMNNLSAKANQEDLRAVTELIEAGIVKPVIDRRYPIAEVAEAFRYYDQGHTRGKIVITVK